MNHRITSYEEARQYLTARLDFEGQPHARPYSSTYYSLDRFVRLLGRMGDPHRKVPSVHIAGSKGKGSVAVLLESSLLAAGYRVGTYTSPHLRDYPDRFRIGGRGISELEFTEILAGIVPSVESDGREGGDPAPYRTVFELLTAMAFDLFARRELDIAVLETGLGGRLDCTNVVRPEVSVITPLGLDHTALLGPTLDRIAFEKGGIIKEGIPVVIAAQSAAAEGEGMPVLERLATERHASVVRAETLFEVERLSGDEGGQKALLKGRGKDLPASLEVSLGLLGDHQLGNLQTAAAVWGELGHRGWDLPWHAFVAGVEAARWPGRMEIVASRPRVVVDGAHCPLSARALKRTLDDLYPGAGRHVIFGAQRDKDVGAIVRALLEEAPMAAAGVAGAGGGREPVSNPRSWLFYTVPGGRGAPGAELAEKARIAGVRADRVEVYGTATEALEAAFGRARPEEVIVSCGTLYTIAEVLDRARARIPQSCP